MRLPDPLDGEGHLTDIRYANMISHSGFVLFAFHAALSAWSGPAGGGTVWHWRPATHHCNRHIAPVTGHMGETSPRTACLMAEEFILSTAGLTKEFKGFVAVDCVEINVRPKSIHALIGPNGAGKTTCFNLLTKFLTPTKGHIYYKGNEITGRKPSEIARMGIVRSFQISAVFPQLTALENVRVAIQRRMGPSFSFWQPKSVLNKYNEEATALLEAVGLTSHAQTSAAALPYGLKRALELATTLALEPELLLLDEPTAGMASADVDKMIDLIKRVSADRTVLMVEHNLKVVARLSDIVTVLSGGSVIAQGDYDTVSNDPRVISAYIGGSRDHH